MVAGVLTDAKHTVPVLMAVVVTDADLTENLTVDIVAGDIEMSFSQSFEWFLDMETKTENLQVLTITAGGEQVKRRLLPFFSAFKYYKLGKVSVRMVPASTLPVDPTGLSYTAGENTVDPRDQFNPGLVRITNGETFFEDSLISNATIAENVFHNMMLDPRWYKFSLQSGMKRSAYPKFWDVAQLQQDPFPGSIFNQPYFGSSGLVENSAAGAYYRTSDSTQGYHVDMGSDPRGLFQTGMKQPMGWMPTDAYYATEVPNMISTSGIAPVPEVELMRIILPKAYKTKYYYRIYVEETVTFGAPVAVGVNNYSALDRFIKPGVTTVNPTIPVSPVIPGVFNNDGDS